MLNVIEQKKGKESKYEQEKDRNVILLEYSEPKIRRAPV